MRPKILALLLVVPVLLGQTTERQVRFSNPISPLTQPSGSFPETIAFDYLASSSGLVTGDVSSVYLAKQYTTAHNGVTHLVYRQRFHGIDVHNAAWAANIGRDGVVLNAGGTLYPEPSPVDFAAQGSPASAVVAAVREVNPRAAANYKPSAMAFGATNAVRFAAGESVAEVEGKLVWYAHRGTLLLAWLFNVVDEDGVTGYDVAVEAATGAIIRKQPTTFFQAPPKALVFDLESPQPNPVPGVRLTSAPAVVERKLLSLTGDPVASPKGWVIDNETAGYNAIVGGNLLGQSFLIPYRSQANLGVFNFPLVLGKGAPPPVAFSDAANVNLFYWVNRAHDLFYEYGFNEAAGNFQADNYGRGGVGGDPLLAYTHFGAAAPVGPALNNAFFSTRSLGDGAPVMIAMYASTSGAGGFFADGAYASDVIVHEYTHGVTLRLLPDGYGSFQTAAMGEAWSDFFGLEFTLPPGGQVHGSYPTGEYFIQSWGTGIRTRPYSTNTTVNPLTFANLGHVLYLGGQVHADGEIWAQALWEARANLIEQFGETEGRRRIRQLVVDGLMLSPPSPTMVDARDAILLADQVDFEGASQHQLWSAFAKRGLGALAYSDGGDTIHVVSSFDMPSATAKLKFHDDTFVAGEPIRVLLNDLNLTQPVARVEISTTSGDREDVVMERTGSVYIGVISSSPTNVAPRNGIVNIVPDDLITATYSDSDPADLVATTVTSLQPYNLVISTAPSTGLPPFAGEVRLTNVRAPVIAALPFEFPFFEKKYQSMVVYPTGALIFQRSLSTDLFGPGCNDATELRTLAAIAPLFTNLTFGTAQPNEGIFMGTPAPNTVSIRWTAETLPSPPVFGPAIPEPVNFAVTITSEGVITFFYGSGNQNLHTAAQTLTTCGSQPTVGISNGHDVYARTVTLRTYNNAGNLTFLPTFGSTTTPEVILERPAMDETVRDVLRVSGIAYTPATPGTLSLVTRRDVFIDGIQRGVAVAAARPDYCASSPVNGCPGVGFQADINVAALNLTSGRHTVSVRVTNIRGGQKETSVSFDIPPFSIDGPARPAIGVIEAPAAGAELSGTAIFSGYAYALNLRVTRVDLLIDGITYPAALYGAARADICGALPAPAPPNCPNVGWTLTLNTRTGPVPLQDGSHTMQLRVLDELGRYSLFPTDPIPFTVNNGPQLAPIGAITSIKPNDRLSGVVSISGYAYSPAGRILTVVLLVDGTGVALATYGQPRPEECSTLVVVACPNIGFNLNFDTRLLTNGHHVIGVRITNDAGIGVTVPDQVRRGMNVLVDNK